METLRKVRTIVIILVFVSSIFYVSNEYIRYNTFFGEKFPDDFSFNLGRYLLSYTSDFKIDNFDNKKELEKLDIWLQENFKFSDYEDNLLEYGYSIKELPSKNLYLFCLNGPDGKPSNKNVSRIKNLELDKSELVKEPSFIQFLLGKKDFDIALFAYSPHKPVSSL